MPYRRLPNTDNARIKALKHAVDRGYSDNMPSMAIGLKDWTEAKNFLPRFEKAHLYYKQCYDNQVRASKKHQDNVKMARLFISHFIQVLHLAMIRGEIKDTHREVYGLSTQNFTLPDLVSEASIVEWGVKIIEGEKKRTRQGGIPIYNPTIAKVSVHYEIFKDSYYNQQNLKKLTAKSLEALASLRKKADEIILEMWNQVEAKYEGMPEQERIDKCREYGLVYYYRTGEKKKVTL